MGSTPEGCHDISMIKPSPYVSTKKPSARKSLRQFTEKLDVKHKTGVCGFGAARATHKAIKKLMCYGQTLSIAVIMKK